MALVIISDVTNKAQFKSNIGLTPVCSSVSAEESSGASETLPYHKLKFGWQRKNMYNTGVLFASNALNLLTQLLLFRNPLSSYILLLNNFKFKERIKVSFHFVKSVDIKIDATLYSAREESVVFTPVLFITGGKSELVNRHKNLIILYCTILLW